MSYVVSVRLLPRLCLYFSPVLFLFFFNDTATTEIYTLSLHDALPIYELRAPLVPAAGADRGHHRVGRSEEHTSELQSPQNLVCRLLLEKKKKNKKIPESQKNVVIVSAKHRSRILRPSYVVSLFYDIVLLFFSSLLYFFFFFFFNDPAPPEIYPLSLHDALPISTPACRCACSTTGGRAPDPSCTRRRRRRRSEEPTSELQSPQNSVCRLLLE